jgi:hypothetical protein
MELARDVTIQLDRQQSISMSAAQAGAGATVARFPAREVGESRLSLIPFGSVSAARGHAAEGDGSDRRAGCAV